MIVTNFLARIRLVVIAVMLFAIAAIAPVVYSTTLN
jgi:hypothetical protein